MTPLEAVILMLYYGVLGILTVYSVHRAYLVRLRRRNPQPQRLTADIAPALTIQLPLFNEPAVAGRLLDAVAAIQYGGPLEIQVLDDSTDETSGIVAARVVSMQARGIRIAHIRRGSRAGYKAGALAHGMSLSRSELFAVFDADFVPPPDILRNMVPFFADRRVGMVQARWTHLNRGESQLTRVQAIFLDAHFAVESAARNFGARFFNFNGTAGIWRRRAIEQAGGWSSSTLTEDLDLSYRAQLAGWQFVYLNDVCVPAELPAGWSGFQAQQHRWARGSIQTARKLGAALLRADVPGRVKVEALFHLTNNSAYLLTVLLSLLIVPAMYVRYAGGVLWISAVDAILFGISTASVLTFYVEGQRCAGRRTPALIDLLSVLPVGVGMSLRNAAAVAGGIWTRGGHFRRTPKKGDGPAALGDSPPRLPWGEGLLLGFFAAAFGAFAGMGRWLPLPFLLLFVGGYAQVVCGTLAERLNYSSKGS